MYRRLSNLRLTRQVVVQASTSGLITQHSTGWTTYGTSSATLEKAPEPFTDLLEHLCGVGMLSGSNVHGKALCYAALRISCFDSLLQLAQPLDRHPLILLAPHDQHGARDAKTSG